MLARTPAGAAWVGVRESEGGNAALWRWGRLPPSMPRARLWGPGKEELALPCCAMLLSSPSFELGA